MTRRIDIRPVADHDLDGHFAFIAADSIEAASRLFDAAHATYRELAEMPGSGARCDERLPRLRGLRRLAVRGFRNYIIYYRPLSDGVEIVRLLHGAQDRRAILRRME